MIRVAVIDRDLCKPDKCAHECQTFCPVVRMGLPAVEFKDDKPYINEDLCNGCGICVKKCPFEAITIVNLPSELEEELIHQYDINGFRLFRLPVPSKEGVLGIIGRNGTGKSTAIKILANKLIPNLGDLMGGEEDRVLEYFRGHQLYYYFKELYNGNIKIAYKPQEVYLIPKVVRGKVEKILTTMDEVGNYDYVIDRLGLKDSVNKSVRELSGGEMQRLAIAAASLKDADVYLFDEPSSYNDVYQRMAVARFIRELRDKGKIVVVVDHDLAFLDYLSDTISVVYGVPGAYGIFTRPESVRTGINIFLDGYIPADNIRFRQKPITFAREAVIHSIEGVPAIKYTMLEKRYPGFRLRVEEGELYFGEVVGVIGPNAIGKTTFMRILVGEIDMDMGSIMLKPESIAYKPQYLSMDYDGTVEQFLIDKAGEIIKSPQANESLLKPLNIINLLDRKLNTLSGGELQKVYIAATLLTDADLYLLDEPSAFIDVEDRLEVAMAINRFIKLNGKPALVIDHDLIIIDIISDRIMVFGGDPGVEGRASKPLTKRDAMNMFLSDVNITMRRDKHSGRPRINKPNSRLDREQREKNEYYYVT
jgi:ATP-binding cassette subfamily E protein 1